MKIKNGSIEYSNGSVILKYPITSSDLLGIKKNRLFNFQEIFFETDLPTSFNEGFINIIAEKKHADHFRSGEDFELIPDKWNILSLEADNKRYETFISLRREGKIPGSLEEALMNFSIKKATLGEDLSKESQGNLKDVLSEIVDLGVKDKMDDDHLENIIGGFISKVGPEHEIDISGTIEDYLNVNGIPVDRENDCYYFTVTVGDNSWNVEIGTSADGRKIIVYSSFSYQSTENLDESLLKDINQLNQALEDGHLEIDLDYHVFYLKSEVEINLFKIDIQLKQLIDANFESMKAILPILREKYKPKIIFSS